MITCQSKCLSNYFQMFLRQPAGKQNKIDSRPVILEKVKRKKQTINEESIICKACNHLITNRSQSISVGNSHFHTFANPSGLLFDIGCFKSAHGCLNTGPFTEEFSWFRGFKWRVSICESCFTHLGWFFLSNSNHFYGLILDRLTDTGK